jgi:26S proteasome regulatory subunit N6
MKYMILAKIMLNSADDVNAILNGKYASKYAGRDLEAMKSIAQAHNKRSLQDFQRVLKEFQNGNQTISKVKVFRNPR